MVNADGPEVSVIAHPVAKKTHECFECHRNIETGERYYRDWQIYESEIHVYKLCGHCAAAAEGWLGPVCHGWLYGGIRDDLADHMTEHWYPVRTASLGRIVVAANNGWKRADGTLWPVETIVRWARNGAALAVGNA
jgi:hypothetical protein